MDDVWLVDVGGTWVRVGVADARCRTPSFAERTPSQVEDALNVLSRGVEHALSQAKARIKLYVSVGGLIRQDGLVSASIYTPFAGINLKNYLHETHGVKAWVENDARFQLRGLPRSARTTVLITIGTGVGGAAGLAGHPLPSASGFAGEFGHAFFGFGLAACPCGRRGCIDLWLGGRSRERRLGGGWYDRLAESQIAADVTKSVKHFKTVLTSLLRLYDPSAVFLAGKIFKIPEFRTGAHFCAADHWSRIRLAIVHDSWIIGTKACRRLSRE